MSEKAKSKCIDTMGHRLNKGDWVTVMPQPNTIWVAQITEITEGGITLITERKQTPAKIRVVIDITLTAPVSVAGIGVFPNLLITTPPNSDEILDKIMEEMEKNPPPPNKDPNAN